jgi:1-deoxy-D-xylulose-5-phosphate reductoisomerase
MKSLAILGSTGSIGVSTLEIVAAHPERFRVTALTAGRNLDLLARQVRCFQPQLVAVPDAADAQDLQARLGAAAPRILSGRDGLIACAAASGAELVVSAIVGAAGLEPTLAAIDSGIDVALANKETLVAAGELVMAAVARQGVRLFPVDSEHSAIFQSLAGHRRDDVRRLILTASGGRSATAAPPNWKRSRRRRP